MIVTELFQTLQQRRIKIEVCGDKLRVQAPSGALTPELKAHLQELKAEVISALSTTTSEGGTMTDIPGGQCARAAEASTTPRDSAEAQEERLLQFAQTVSRMAAVFPSHCQMEQLPPNTTVAQWLAQQQQQADKAAKEARRGAKSTPFLLPPLPRTLCPAKVLI
jgi:hypothetical protein